MGVMLIRKLVSIMKITNYQSVSVKNFNKPLENHRKDNAGMQGTAALPSFSQRADNWMHVDKQKFEKYKQAQKYVDGCDNRYMSLSSYDPDKLEGIQYGIKVFEGLNIRQVILLVDRLHAICTSRTCSNGCVHCYAEAKPFHVKKDDTGTITKMCWEDFCDLTDGIRKFANRMHKTANELPYFKSKTIAPFIDADSMEIVLNDQKGREYDMIDISKKIARDLKYHIMFDTSGWTPKNKKIQERAQRYVDYFKQQYDNGNKDVVVHISLNPFHKLNSKYVEYINSDPKRAKKFRELYTDRMANVFYTFLSLDGVKVLNRALSEHSSGNELYKYDAHVKLIKEIRDKLEEKYKADASCTPESAKKYLETFDRITKDIYTEDLGATGRLENLLSKDDADLTEALKLHKLNHQHPESILTNKRGFVGSVFVDANGRVYATDEYNTIATDIQLNFRNKNKKTPPIFGLIEGQVSSDALFKNLKDNFII